MTRLRPDCRVPARVLPSPNHGERKGGRRPDLLLLHYTGMADAASAIRRLRDPAAEVSSHYVVLETGRIVQLVPEAARAWHAGVSTWAGETDLNSLSVGIEIVNPGHDGGCPDFPAAQINAVTALCADIAARWSIPPQRVLGHSDVAPGRKVDPGERFPWDRLHAAGVGHWVPPAEAVTGPTYRAGDEGQPVQAVQALLRLYGYGLDVTGVFDARTETVVAAFQRHFRPARVDGIADPGTLATLRDLLRALPG